MNKTVRFFAVLISVVLLLFSVPLGASAMVQPGLFDESPYLSAGETAVYDYVVEDKGWYLFTSYEDVAIILYDVGMNEITRATEELRVPLDNNKYYYLGVEFVDPMKSGDVLVRGGVTTSADWGEIVQLPEKTYVIEGVEEESLSLEGLRIRFSFCYGRFNDGYSVWEYGDGKTQRGTEVIGEFLRDEYGEIIVVDGKAQYHIQSDDAVVTLELDVLENPVESIEYIGDPVICYYGKGGEYVTDYYDEEFYLYDWDFPENTDFIINFKDGTSENFCGSGHTYPGMSTGWNDDQWENHWGIGEHAITLTYMNVQTTVPVYVVEKMVENIEVTRYPDVTLYESLFYPLWEGMEIKITLEDGSEIVKTVSEDEITGNPVLSEFYFEAEGLGVTIRYGYDWAMGMEFYTVSCGGKSERLYDFRFTDTKDAVKLNVLKMTNTGEGAVVEVEYDTYEKEVFVFDHVMYDYDYLENDDDSYTEYISGRVRTKHGYAGYDLVPVVNEDGALEGYEFLFLGTFAYLEPDEVLNEVENKSYLYGDADENGIVNIKDATAIQKDVADMTELTELGAYLSDVDMNGTLNVKDATAIQKHLAGINTGFPIGEIINDV